MLINSRLFRVFRIFPKSVYIGFEWISNQKFGHVGFDSFVRLDGYKRMTGGHFCCRENKGARVWAKVIYLKLQSQLYRPCHSAILVYR
ncbi:hypothetical protein Hanom_Chr02g00133221 [Helianthus anomalus]